MKNISKITKKQIKELRKRVAANEWKQHIHKPYQEKVGHPPDFIVEYELDPAPELQNGKPCQGLRCDFLYKGDDPHTDGNHIIWPELLDEAGQVVIEKIPGNIRHIGKANMWILFDESRPLHASGIKVGTEGFWMIGSLKLAKVRVIEIVYLKG